MKLYTKRNFTNSIFSNIFCGILLTFIAMGSAFSLYSIAVGTFEYSSSEPEGILSIVFYAGFLITYVWMFLISPRKYRFTLVYKQEETYKGKEITTMGFSGFINFLGLKLPRMYTCYALGSNSLEINEDYMITRSRFEGFPINVEEIER